MKIIIERTRIIFENYSEEEKAEIEDLVGTIDKSFYYEDRQKKRICIPPGLVEEVARVFPETKPEERIKNYWEFALINPVNHKMKWRNKMQEDFIKFLIKEANNKTPKVVGILAPGAGKTFMACYSAIQVGARTLIITPTASIRDQWVQTLLNMFGVNPSDVTNAITPKDFFHGKTDFVVTTQSMLLAIDKNYDLERLLKDMKFGIKIIDECHLFFSNLIRIDGSSNICHNWYLTGTFGRSGIDEDKLYKAMFSDAEVFSVKDKPKTIFNSKPGNVYGEKPHTFTTMIWTHSQINKEQLKSVMISNRQSERSGQWVRYGISIPAYTQVVMPTDGRWTPFMKTLKKVIELADNKVKYGKMLILLPTVEVVDLFHAVVSDMFPKYVVARVHSKVKIPSMVVLKKEADVIVSTVKSTGTGFDWKGLSKLILCDQFKSSILTSQVIGRLRRRDDNRPTYMWDIVDADVRQLRVWANSRAEVEKKVSKDFKVVDM